MDPSGSYLDFFVATGQPMKKNNMLSNTGRKSLYYKIVKNTKKKIS
jgi:hypothetical protein